MLSVSLTFLTFVSLSFHEMEPDTRKTAFLAQKGRYGPFLVLRLFYLTLKGA